MTRAALYPLTLLIIVLCAALTAAFPAHARSMLEAPARFSPDMSAFHKWIGMRARYETQKVVPEAECGAVAFAPCNLHDWRDTLDGLRAAPLLRQLDAVNDYANAFPYTLDSANWNQEDYWETPNEFHAISGDCEDYAITKYDSLRRLGVPASRLRIIILQDLNLGGIVHAVLGVYGRGGLRILDNQLEQVMLAADIYHYKPIYAINEQGWWVFE